MNEQQNPDPDEQETTESAGPGDGDSGAGERPRRLLRSSDDRMLAGVAGGLGEYFNLDPMIVRIAFALSVFFGGIGIVAYLGLTLFVPVDRGEEKPVALYQRSRTWFVVAIGFVLIVALPALGSGLLWGEAGSWALWLLCAVAVGIAIYAVLADRERPPRGGRLAVMVLAAIGVTIGLLVLATGAMLVTALGYGAAVAMAVVAIGLALIALALAGAGRWLILPAAALVLGVGVASASDLDLEGGVGDRLHRPATVASVPADGYRLGIGRLAVDLRDLDWREGTALDLEVDLGIGALLVAVPEDVCVLADARVGVGEMVVAGEHGDGLGVRRDAGAAPAGGPTLLLEGGVDIGVLEVRNDDDIDVVGHRFDEHRPDEEARRLNAAACAGG